MDPDVCDELFDGIDMCVRAIETVAGETCRGERTYSTVATRRDLAPPTARIRLRAQPRYIDIVRRVPVRRFRFFVSATGPYYYDNAIHNACSPFL